jgi:integrase
MKKKKQKPKHVGLTIRSIEAMKIPEVGRTIIHDRLTRGLAVIRLPSAHWNFVWWRKVGPKARWLTLGEYPSLTIGDARLAAAELNTRLAKWKLAGQHGDPFADRTSPTLQDVWTRYQREQLQFAKNPARARDQREKQFKKYFGDLAGKKVAQISRDDCRNFLASFTAPVLANRCVEFLKTMLNFAERSEMYPGPNPARGIRLNRETPRDRYLSPDELRKLFTAMDESVEHDRDAVDFIKLSLFCGARKSDTISMRWQDLDLENKIWRVPTPKNSKPYLIPLSHQAVEIIERRRDQFAAVSEWVFPHDREPARHRVSCRLAWERIIQRAELKNVTLHDCRRTYATLQAGLPGSSLILIGRSLGHSDTKATQIYAQAQLESVRDSVQKASDAISSIVKAKKE